jgi:hypothetical protein
VRTWFDDARLQNVLLAANPALAARDDHGSGGLLEFGVERRILNAALAERRKYVSQTPTVCLILKWPPILGPVD